MNRTSASNRPRESHLIAVVTVTATGGGVAYLLWGARRFEVGAYCDPDVHLVRLTETEGVERVGMLEVRAGQVERTSDSSLPSGPVNLPRPPHGTPWPCVGMAPGGRLCPAPVAEPSTRSVRSVPMRIGRSARP